MPAEPRVFAQRVIDAFEANNLFTDIQIERANGPSSSTMTKLRKVASGEESMNEPREPTWTKIDTAARWAPGSARRLWRGEEPEPLVGGLTQDAHQFVEAPGGRVESGVSNEDLLREILRSRADNDQIKAEQREQRQMLTALSERVEKLEQSRP